MGQKQFSFFLDKAGLLLQQSQKQKNPGWWLYKNNLRTPMFMLEALCKAHASFHNKNKFDKLKERFKQMEDALGAIDYYDAFATEFSGSKNIPAAVTKYLQAQAVKKTDAFNQLLKEDDWLQLKRISKINEKLDEADWKDESKEVKELEKFYGRQIEKLNGFWEETKGHFDNVEADVHELRRKLRWLSIYPQAFCGIIQLSEIKPVEKKLGKYLTADITGSPYNKMPDAADNSHFLLLSKNHFYALSWMISELGKLKDAGLKILALKEAIQHTKLCSDDAAYNEAYALLGKNYPKLESLLKQAEKTSTQFFKEKNLEALVIGAGKTI